mgnify:CR=1 FL=1
MHHVVADFGSRRDAGRPSNGLTFSASGSTAAKMVVGAEELIIKIAIQRFKGSPVIRQSLPGIPWKRGI